MLLGALVDVGVPVAVLQAAVERLGVEPIRLHPEPVRRAGLAAVHVRVQVRDSAPPRAWPQVRALLEAADLAPPVRDRALAVFARLAEAEGRVHGMDPEEVHFHEVGALDALADVVGVVAGLHHLGLTGLTAGRVALGSGTAEGAHGRLPVPTPAVLALLAGAPVQAGPGDQELATPTGAALLAELADGWGGLPPLTVRRVGTGAGSRDPAGVPNVLRIVLGDPAPAGADEVAVLLSANVDDLDPRVWPTVLDRLLSAGASDAWLTPILMKKGRPAHTVSVLCPEPAAPALRRVLVTETTTIGLREQRVAKTALDRREVSVVVAGRPVRVKLASYEGEVVNAMPEYADVLAVADETGRPVKELLVLAHRAAAQAGPP